MKLKLKNLFAAFLFCVCANMTAQSLEDWKNVKGDVTVFVANDTGRNGYYDQKQIAETMGCMAEVLGPECVIAPGDVHHFNGVASVNDPLWMTNFETIYSHPELMIDWHPVLGNHEYRGNTQAVLDYSKVSRRWVMDGRYYTRVFEDDGVAIRVVFIDTTPLIDKYRKDTEKYADACKQNMEEQLSWLDKTLAAAKEQWVIVVGHHPIYADTYKSESERQDMQQRVLPLLKKYGNVDMYVCGHIHNFQHISKPSDSIDYVVNSAGALSRNVQPIDGTMFCSPQTGFSFITATNNKLALYMVDKKGKKLHEIVKKQ